MSAEQGQSPAEGTDATRCMMECRGQEGGKWKSIYLIVKGKRCSTLRSNLFCQQGADMIAESRGGSGGDRGEGVDQSRRARARVLFSLSLPLTQHRVSTPDI